jgi:hypothetical protein
MHRPPGVRDQLAGAKPLPQLLAVCGA